MEYRLRDLVFLNLRKYNSSKAMSSQSLLPNIWLDRGECVFGNKITHCCLLLLGLQDLSTV